jgi:lactoylglutathione lyase
VLGFASHRCGERMMPGGYSRPAGGRPSGVELAFFTADVAAAFERACGAGASTVAEPKVMPWGQTVAYVRSIEGTIIGLCSPLEK